MEQVHHVSFWGIMCIPGGMEASGSDCSRTVTEDQGDLSYIDRGGLRSAVVSVVP